MGHAFHVPVRLAAPVIARFPGTRAPDGPTFHFSLKDVTMRLRWTAMSLALALAPGLLRASDDGPISALAAIAVSAADDKTVGQATAEHPSSEQTSDDENGQSSPDRGERRRGRGGPHRRRPGGQFGFRMAGPMLARFGEQTSQLPDDMKLTITKAGKEPAEITVTRGDKSWSVKDADLNDLPPEVRASVAKFVGFGLLSKFHAAMTGFPRSGEAQRGPGRDHREARRRHGHRHHAHHGRHDGRRGEFGEGRYRGHHQWAGHHGRFAHHRRSENRQGHFDCPICRHHQRLALRHSHGSQQRHTAMGSSAFGGLGGQLEQLVSRLERLLGMNASHQPLESRLPGMINWFGRERPQPEHRRHDERGDTAELREEVRRLQQQQERMANVLRDLTEALSRTRRD